MDGKEIQIFRWGCIERINIIQIIHIGDGWRRNNTKKERWLLVADGKIEKMRFKLRRIKVGFDYVDAGEFVGFVRGLTKLTTCQVLPTIETESDEHFYVIDVRPVKIEEKWIDFAKRQAESYGVVVEIVRAK